MSNSTGSDPVLSFGIDQTAFNKSLDDAAKSVQAFDKKFVAVAERLQSALDKLATSFRGFSAVTTGLKADIGSTTELFRASRDAATAYGKAIKDSADVIGKSRTAFEGVSSSLSGLDRKLSASATAFQGIDTALKGVDIEGFDRRVSALATSLGKIRDTNATPALRALSKVFGDLTTSAGGDFSAFSKIARGIERLNTAASNSDIGKISATLGTLGTSLAGISTSKAVTDMTAFRDVVREVAASLLGANTALQGFAQAAGAGQLGNIARQASQITIARPAPPRQVTAQTPATGTTTVQTPAIDAAIARATQREAERAARAQAQSVKEAARIQEQAARAAAKEIERAAKSSTREAEKAARTQEQAAKAATREAERAAKAAAREAERAARVGAGGRRGGAGDIIPPNANKTLRQAVQNVRDLTRSTRELSGETKRFSTQFLSAYREFERPIAQLRVALLNLRTLFGFLGGSFVFKQLTESAAEFETAIARVNTLLLDDTRVSIEEYSRNIQRLALTTSKSVVDLTQGVYTALSAGLESDDSSRGAFAVAAEASKLATVGLSSQAAATEAVVSLLNAYDDASVSAADAANLLFQTVVVGRTTVDKLGRSFGRVAAIGSQFGIQGQELAAALGEITRVVPVTSEAITQLRALLLGIARATPATQARLAQLGKQLGKPELAGLFSARSLETRGLFGVLKELNGAIGSSGDLIARIFPNVRALVGGAVLSSRGLKNFENSIRRFEREQDPIGRALPRVENTFEERKGRAQNRIRTTLDRVGANILPTVAKGFEQLALFIEKNEDKITKLAESVVRAFFGIADAVKTFVFAVQSNTFIGVFVDLAKSVAGAVASLRDFGQVLSFLLTVLLGSKLLSAFGRLGAFLSTIQARAAASAAAAAATAAQQQAANSAKIATVGAYAQAARQNTTPVAGAGGVSLVAATAGKGISSGIDRVAKQAVNQGAGLGARFAALGATWGTALGNGLVRAVSLLGIGGILASVAVAAISVVGDIVNRESKKLAEEAAKAVEAQGVAADEAAKRRGFVDYQDFLKRLDSVREGQGLVRDQRLIQPQGENESILTLRNAQVAAEGELFVRLRDLFGRFNLGVPEQPAQVQLLESLDLTTDSFINFRQAVDSIVAEVSVGGKRLKEGVDTSEAALKSLGESALAARENRRAQGVAAISAGIVEASNGTLAGLNLENQAGQLFDTARSLVGEGVSPEAFDAALSSSLSEGLSSLLAQLGPAFIKSLQDTARATVEQDRGETAALFGALDDVDAAKEAFATLAKFDIKKITDINDAALEPIKKRIFEIADIQLDAANRLKERLDAATEDLATITQIRDDAAARIEKAVVTAVLGTAAERGRPLTSDETASVRATVQAQLRTASRENLSSQETADLIFQPLARTGAVAVDRLDELARNVSKTATTFVKASASTEQARVATDSLNKAFVTTRVRAENFLKGLLDGLQSIVDKNREDAQARLAEGAARQGASQRVKETEVSIDRTLRGLQRQIDDKRLDTERKLIEIRTQAIDLATREFEIAQARAGLIADAADAAERERAAIQRQITADRERLSIQKDDLDLLQRVALISRNRGVNDFEQSVADLSRQAANLRNQAAAATTGSSPNPIQAGEFSRQAALFERAAKVAGDQIRFAPLGPINTDEDGLQISDFIPGFVEGLTTQFRQASFANFQAEIDKLVQNAQSGALEIQKRLGELEIDIQLKPIIREADLRAAIADLQNQIAKTSLDSSATNIGRARAILTNTRDRRTAARQPLAGLVNAIDPDAAGRIAARDTLDDGPADDALARIEIENALLSQQLDLDKQASEIARERTIAQAKLAAGATDAVKAQIDAELELLDVRERQVAAQRTAAQETRDIALEGLQRARDTAVSEAQRTRTGGDLRDQATANVIAGLSFGSNILADAITTALTEGSEGFSDLFARAGSRVLLGFSNVFKSFTDQVGRILTGPLDDLGSAFTQPLDNLFGVLGGTLNAIIGFNRPEAAGPQIPAVLQDGRFGDLPFNEQQRVLAQIRAQDEARKAQAQGEDGGPKTAVEAGVQAFEQLFEGAIDAINAVAEIFPVLFERFLTRLLDRFPELVNKLAEVVGKGIAIIIKNLPEIIASIVKGLFSGIGGLFSGLFGGIFHDGGKVRPHMRNPSLAGRLAGAGAAGFQFGGYVSGKNSLSQAVASRVSQDDVVALLQPGERVVSNKEMARIGGPGAMEAMLNNGPNPTRTEVVGVPTGGGMGGRIEGFSPQAIEGLTKAFRAAMGGSTVRTGRGRGV